MSEERFICSVIDGLIANQMQFYLDIVIQFCEKEDISESKNSITITGANFSNLQSWLTLIV